MIWIDVETTGLYPLTDRILEIGFIVTDDDLKELARASWIRHADPTETLDPWIQKTHGANGLLEECYAKHREIFKLPDPSEAGKKAAREMLDFLTPWVKDKPPLCGSSVDFDKNFIKMNHFYELWLPQLFSYRVIDVSTIKELAKIWAPDVYEKRPKDRSLHRVLPDIEDSIAELKYYRSTGFIG